MFNFSLLANGLMVLFPILLSSAIPIMTNIAYAASGAPGGC